MLILLADEENKHVLDIPNGYHSDIFYLAPGPRIDVRPACH